MTNGGDEEQYAEFQSNCLSSSESEVTVYRTRSSISVGQLWKGNKENTTLGHLVKATLLYTRQRKVPNFKASMRDCIAKYLFETLTLNCFGASNRSPHLTIWYLHFFLVLKLPIYTWSISPWIPTHPPYRGVSPHT